MSFQKFCTFSRQLALIISRKIDLSNDNVRKFQFREFFYFHLQYVLQANYSMKNKSAHAKTIYIQ